MRFVALKSSTEKLVYSNNLKFVQKILQNYSYICVQMIPTFVALDCNEV